MRHDRVTKQFDLQGRDEQDLQRRVEKLRQALRAQNGTVVEVQWSRGGTTGLPTASIVYSIPSLMMTA